MPETTPNRVLEAGVAVLVVGADQAAKALVRASLPLYASRPFIPGFIDFTHVANSGVAYGFLQNVTFPFKTALLALVSTAAMLTVATYAASLSRGKWIVRVGLALIIGGAAGNLIDRVTAGSVVDFVDVYWRTHHFWVFNVADSAISVGVGLMILDMLGLGGHASKTA